MLWLRLAVDRQIRALRQVLPQQSVDVLIGTPLPWAMRVSKVDRCPCLLSDLGMLHHLFALVIGHGQAQGAWHLIELVAEADSRCCSGGAIYFRQDN